MQEKKQNESGSMMMEIMAVLAILAIMTPIVYQQALKRSREISNVNMADEMRSIWRTKCARSKTPLKLTWMRIQQH